MKKLFILTAIVAGTLFATRSDAQVYVGARFGRVGFGVRVPTYPRRYYRGPVAYGGAYVAPAPVYTAPDPAYVEPAPVVDPGYAPAPVFDYNEFPGYAYYNYPVWNGHFRDRIYYEHYRPVFFREHPAYRSFYRGGGRRYR